MNTDYLFASPSALYGFARVLDLFGQVDRYNYSDSPETADLVGIECDWDMVRKDLERALAKMKSEDGEVQATLEAMSGAKSQT